MSDDEPVEIERSDDGDIEIPTLDDVEVDAVDDDPVVNGYGGQRRTTRRSKR